MSDYLVRATAAQGYIRAFAATTRELTEQARQIHETSPVATAALGRLMTGGLMMGSMMKGDKDLLTLQMQGDGPMRGQIVTVNARGQVKGYVYEPGVLLPPNALKKLDVGGAIGNGTLTVIRDLGLKEPYTGSVELVNGEVAEDLTYYFAASEQTPSAVGLGVLMNLDNTVRRAGGFIIQLMPFIADEVTDRLEEKLSAVSSVTSMLDADMSPEDILQELLGWAGLEINDTMPLSYHCDCSRERVEKALISIGDKELDKLIAEGETIEVGCEFCGKRYSFETEQLKELRGCAAQRER
ncbi:MAG: Hsp33 family molecular chaperone HslO [Lachnospiraceae bacterium]|nr:Hsp33 family molecular chaperone HslO [Lachnospiraceae bacterium]